MRARRLFARHGIERDLISLRRALRSHADLLAARPFSLREATRRLPVANDGAGQGCRDPFDAVIVIPIAEVILSALTFPIGNILPAWAAAHPQETRTVEGVLLQSNVTHTDFPLAPWHTDYDWNFHVLEDPQYAYLKSVCPEEKAAPLRWDGTRLVDNTDRLKVPTFECEWDTGHLPSFAWPLHGDRVWMRGRWIHDCGHPKTSFASCEAVTEPHAPVYRSEIHPPKALVSFRSEAAQLDGNAAPVRARQAVLYIARSGGYWKHAINDEDYEFDLHLPPRPPRGGQRVVTHVRAMTGELAVQPILVPHPPDDPRLLRVRIPLEGVQPHPDKYGAVISAGWSDDDGSQAREVHHCTVTFTSLVKHGDSDLDGRRRKDEWHVYIGVNGRWKTQVLTGKPGRYDLSFSVTLDLHATDAIRINACGFEADTVNRLMGKSSKVSSGAAGLRKSAGVLNKDAKAIRNAFLKHGLARNENEALELLAKNHVSAARGDFESRSIVQDSSSVGAYTLAYTIT